MRGKLGNIREVILLCMSVDCLWTKCRAYRLPSCIFKAPPVILGRGMVGWIEGKNDRANVGTFENVY